MQRWYFVRLRSAAPIRVETDDPKDQEFVAYRWMPLGQLAEETWEVRRPIYLKPALHLAALRQAAVRGCSNRPAKSDSFEIPRRREYLSSETCVSTG